MTRILSLIPNFCKIDDSTYPFSTNVHWRTREGEGLLALFDDEGPKLFVKKA
jgi:hypothetical protein